MGTVARIPTRRYHGFLIAAADPPRQRHVVLVTVAVELWLGNRPLPLWQAQWASGVTAPALPGLYSFESVAGFPRFRWDLGSAVLSETLAMVRGHSGLIVRYHWTGPRARLVLTPLFRGAPHHRLGAVTPSQVSSVANGVEVRWPGAGSWTVRGPSATVTVHPDVYWDMFYAQEADRGYDAVDNLWTPGAWEYSLAAGSDDAWLVVEPADGLWVGSDPARWYQAEMARRQSLTARCGQVGLAAEAFLVEGRDGRASVIAGYPWFADWGRDTFIALPGLAQALREPDWVRRVLETFREMAFIPNRWAEETSERELNSADASLWYVIVASRWGLTDPTVDLRPYLASIDRILNGYWEGHYAGAQVDPQDGLVRVGVPGEAWTWMDARVDGQAVTPRLGKPIEIQALWYNALRFRDAVAERLRQPLRFQRAAESVYRKVNERFDAGERGFWDVVDPADARIRPNQIYAVGLPYALATPDASARILHCVTERLYRPYGLVTLDASDPQYRPVYRGTMRERDRAYHQGMAWPYLLGIFLDAWRRYQASRAEGFARQIRYWLTVHRYEAGIGFVSEITEPETGRAVGCPFQAWSVAELARTLQASDLLTL
jgi:predicted glycogen debranching enzyme